MKDREQGEHELDGEAEPRGIECQRCGCCHFHVVYTRPGLKGKILRRRECRNCGKRVTTHETPIGQPAE